MAELGNNGTRRTVWIALNIVAVFLVLCFIFGNSLLDGQESGEMSGSVLAVLYPIIEPIVSALTGAPAEEELLHMVVRKLAHFTEFAGLALFATLLLLQLCGTWRTHAMGYVLFGTLFSAVVDEFIQSFTGRGPSVRDVLIDFSGALCGIMATLLLFALIRAIISHQKGDRS